MNLDSKRLWISRFLLMLYLTILTAGICHVHQHEEGPQVCSDCSSHAVHHSHLSVASPTDGDCMLCNFFNSSYLMAQTTTLPSAVLVAITLACSGIFSLQLRPCGLPSLRAPPCL